LASTRPPTTKLLLHDELSLNYCIASRGTSLEACFANSG
jgi:hypothetical protein